MSTAVNDSSGLNNNSTFQAPPGETVTYTCLRLSKTCKSLLTVKYILVRPLLGSLPEDTVGYILICLGSDQSERNELVGPCETRVPIVPNSEVTGYRPKADSELLTVYNDEPRHNQVNSETILHCRRIVLVVDTVHLPCPFKLCFP